MNPRTWLVYLDEEECARRLASSTLGRLAVVIDGHPEIFPVNHVYDPDGGGVAFPTEPGTKLHAALAWPLVAFEVDGLEPVGAGDGRQVEGWSVLVVGRAEEVTDPDQIARFQADRHVLWAVGDAEHWLRVVPSKVTGRRIGATPR